MVRIREMGKAKEKEETTTTFRILIPRPSTLPIHFYSRLQLPTHHTSYNLSSLSSGEADRAYERHQQCQAPSLIEPIPTADYEDGARGHRDGLDRDGPGQLGAPRASRRPECARTRNPSSCTLPLHRHWHFRCRMRIRTWGSRKVEGRVWIG